MPRALESIMKELNSVYNPQRDIYNKQINALPGQQEAQMKGLQSAKEDAFNQIVTGANRRGVAFGGIPLEEQQSYLGSSYLPAVANLKNRFIQQKGSLQEALAELAGRQRAEARDIYDREFARELEQQRLAEARRAASGGGGGGGGGFNLGGLFGGGGGNGPLAPTQSVSAPQVDPADVRLASQMFLKSDGSTWSDQDLLNDYNATLQSAKYGNARDIRKIQIYHGSRPDLFGAQAPIPTGAIRPSSGGTQTSLPRSKGAASQLNLIGRAINF